jgi:hypothetical protein
MDALAGRLAEQIAAQRPEPPIALLVRAGSAELGRAFTSVLAGALAQRKLAPVALEVPASSSGEAEARAAGARALVRLTLSIEDGALRARGDLVGSWVNFWSGRTATRPSSPAAALQESAPADALALGLDGASSGELRLTRALFGRVDGWTAALAAGDLDGDRRDEVLALTDDELLAFSPDGRVLARRALHGLPFSPTPCREPFGAVAVDEGARRVGYISAQRARGEWLALDPGSGFRVLGKIERVPLAYAGSVEISGALVPGQTAFDAPNAPASPFNTLSAFIGSGGEELLAVLPSGSTTASAGSAPPRPWLPGRPAAPPSPWPWPTWMATARRRSSPPSRRTRPLPRSSACSARRADSPAPAEARCGCGWSSAVVAPCRSPRRISTGTARTSW